MKKFLSAVTALSLILSAAVPVSVHADNTRAAGEVIRLNPADASPFNNGEFQGWGTSMGWWGNRIGYSDTLAQNAADAFYGEDGLGLDIVRYNVGGGDDPTHNHITRSDSKMPCFAVPQTNTDGSLKKDASGNVLYDYNWDNDHDQVNVLKKIKAVNNDVHIEGYTNSPPWFMTESGCSGGGVDAGENLAPENYAAFAKFAADVAEHFNSVGLKFNSYSPMNEPHPKTKWWGQNSPKQEGNHVAPGEHQSGIIKAVGDEFDSRNIDTLIAGMDENSINDSITSFEALTDDAKAQLDRFDTHSYNGDKRAQIKQTAVSAKKTLWQSEVDGNWNTLGIASQIITDMNGMQPAAWVIWDIIDRHKDADFAGEENNSVSANESLWGVGMADHDTEELVFTNKYYAYGQFSRYIEPGMTIIASSSNTLAAYDKNTGKIVIVALNSDSTDKNVTFDMRDFSKTGTTAKVIRTNESNEKWAEQADIAVTDKQFNATLGAKTITTYIIEGDNTPVNYMTIDGSNTIVSGIEYTFSIGSSDLNFTEVPISWSVSDESMADITSYTGSNTAKVTAKKGGSFTLTATAGDKSTAIDITVLDDTQAITIVNKKSGKGLETKSKGVTSNTQLVQWEYRGLDTSAWKLKATSDSHFNIINQNENMLLASNAEQKPVISNTIQADDDAAKWDLINHGGYFEIKNISAGKSLNVSGQSTANGGSVILYSFGGGDNELWSLSPITGNLEHVVPVVIDYSEKYTGTEYTFVKNVDELTNDFSEELKGFEVKGFAGIGSDGDGEAVLLPQNSLANDGNKQRSGYATLALNKPVSCPAGQLLNLSFDMFTPNSDGTSTFELTAPDGKNIASVKSTSWGNKYALTIGETVVEAEGNGAAYFKNNVSDKQNPSYIKNGGHVEVYYAPATGKVTVTIKNVTGSTALKTYTGTAARGGISKLYFAGEYTAWNKTMVVDNLITNVIDTGKKAEIKSASVSGSSVTSSYSIDGIADSAVAVAALYDKTDKTLKECKVQEVNAASGNLTFTFDANAEEYDLKLMLWYDIDSTMLPLC